MAGPGGAVEILAHPCDTDIGGEAVGIHDRRIGRPEQGAAALLEHARVGGLAARVGGEILVRAELFRVDEDRGDDLVPASPRLGDQGHVAGMERAHRRHQGERAARSAQRRHRLAQRLDVTDNLHRFAALDRGSGCALRGEARRIKRQRIMAAPHFIVFANEKGGTGKSTTAVHAAVALAQAGRRVAAVDLDTRQRTLGRYLDNRAASVERLGVPLPMPAYETFDPAKGEEIDALLDRLGADADILVVDTPGRDDPDARKAMLRADTLVTPINDSFVDLDLIGQVDAETYRVKRPSFYAELVWNSRTQRAKSHGASVDWVVLRNRMQHIEARNMRRVGDALNELSRRVGFRVIPGLGERVIYRELFPKGLTLLDLQQLGEVGIAHIAARQELREMIAGFALPSENGATPAPARAAALAG